jgi:hypothetical protein
VIAIALMADSLFFTGFISQAVKLGTQTIPNCRQFSIQELKEATKNFSLSTCIGDGSIGKVYFSPLEMILTELYGNEKNLIVNDSSGTKLK